MALQDLCKNGSAEKLTLYSYNLTFNAAGVRGILILAS
jgi:hypothetical protein